MARRRNSGRQVYQTDLLGAIRKFLPARGLPLVSEDGRVRWTARMLVVGAILMTWALEPTLADAFAAARTVLVTMYDSRRRPGKTLAGFLKALGRVSDRLLAAVTSSLRAGLRRVAGRSWRFKAWVVLGVDGTRIDCPRTAANERAFGCAGKAGTGPQMWLTTLFHVATGLPWAWRRGPGRDSERDHLKSMLEALPTGTLLLADAGYVGYALLSGLRAAGHDFIVRVGRNVHLLTKLGYAVKEHDGIVYLWPQNRREEQPLVLRLVRVRTGRGTVALLTSVLETGRLSDAQVAAWYRRRWGIEVLYRSLKQTMRRRKMLSTRPRHAGMELDWALVGLWLLGLMAAEAQPKRSRGAWSVAKALRVVRGAMRQPGRPRPAGGLRRRLRGAVRDRYVRHGPKATRRLPRKKNEPPPGNPKIRTATAAEIRHAQAIRSCLVTN